VRPDVYLVYFGIRVTNLKRSLKFYTRYFGLKIVSERDGTKYGVGKFVLLRDKKSGMKLELNWYPKSSKYSSPYSPGEGLDHIAFVVRNLAKFMKKLKADGVEIVHPSHSIAQTLPSGIIVDSDGGGIAYIKDPDGNWIELYEHAGEKSEKVKEAY